MPHGVRPVRWLRLPVPVLFLAEVLLMASPPPAAAAEPVRAILWFDTEDYILPASDDAAKRVAEILTARGIRGTFKVVGEKARVLEKRGRTDVIAALAKHDIAYHTNFHSVHPTPAEYLSQAGWHEGVAEFIRRESGGAADVRRIFGVKELTCYGQPGSSWAPQAIAALPAIGVARCYVDEGSHVGWDSRPIRYCGAITIYDLGANCTRMDLHEKDELERGCRAFQEVEERLRREGGGIISVYYHPCEWVHREFWDGVNFRRGANPPRAEWKLPPQRTPEETAAAFKRFEGYVDFMKSRGVEFVAASDLPRIYEDPVRTDGVTLEEVLKAAKATAESEAVDVFDLGGGRYLSPADQLAAFVEVLVAPGFMPPGRIEIPEILGPAEPPPAIEGSRDAGAGDMRGEAFEAAVHDVRDALRSRRQVPSAVFIGARPVAPADFLRACAMAVEAMKTLKLAVPPSLAGYIWVDSFPRGTRIAGEAHIAKDTPGLYGGWVIHPEGFRAPRIVEMARLQAWTLKPASPRRP